MGRLQGKVAIVTGAAKGMGEASARTMAREGAAVAVSDLDEEAGVAVVEAIRADGGRAIFVRADVSRAGDVHALVEATVAEWGALHVLHNNAGVHESVFTDRTGGLELEEEIFDRVLAINLKGTWLACRAAAPHLAAAGGGSIINVASTAAHYGQPTASAYGPSKAAVLNLTMQMALELAPSGTRVNCCSPGNIETPLMRHYYDTLPRDVADRVRAEATGIHLIPRLGRPQEVANLVLFLASDESSAITGENVMVELGTVAWRGSSVA